MNKNEIRDYNVRIWGGDVFIQGENINACTLNNLFGMQCNYQEESLEYKKLRNIFFEIKDKLLEFDRLVNKVSHEKDK